MERRFLTFCCKNAPQRKQRRGQEDEKVLLSGILWLLIMSSSILVVGW